MVTYPCLIVGDEIAQQVAHYKPECAVIARPGASSVSIQNIKPEGSYERVVISVGTNGSQNQNLGQNLFTIRKRYKNAKVTWIAPRNYRAEEIVFETSVYFHDRIVYIGKIRPKGVLREKDYKAIAKGL